MGKLKLTQIDVLQDKDKVVYFKMSKEDYDNKYVKYAILIERFISRKRPVPQKLFEKFFFLFKNLNEDIEEKYSGLYENKLGKLKSRFMNQPTYQFECKKDGHTYSLGTMLESILHVVSYHYLTKEHTKENTKDNFINVCYLHLLQYVDGLDSKSKKILKPNKLTVISAYLLILFDFHANQNVADKINAGERPTNKDLFKSIWHHTMKIKIEKA